MRAEPRRSSFVWLEGVAGIGCWEDDLANGVSWWSDGLYGIFGFKPDERPATAETLKAIIPQSDLKMINRARDEALASKRQIDLEHRVLHADGHIRWLRLSVGADFNGVGQPQRLYGIYLDITEQKELELRLRLFEKMETLGQLAGGVLHDLNNHLCGILGNADVLVDQLEDTGHRECAERIVNAAARCSELARQNLDFGRIRPLPPASVDIHEMITEIVALLAHCLDERIEVRQSLQAGTSVISGDSTRLQTALLNLALNARDAMPDGGVLEFRTDRIDLDERACHQGGLEIEPGPCLRISVVDSGVGMNAETRRRAFELFFSTKESSGTGMGLVSVQKTVKSHGGAIHVVTAPGRGTRFDIFLPAAAVHMA